MFTVIFPHVEIVLSNDQQASAYFWNLSSCIILVSTKTQEDELLDLSIKVYQI